VTTRRSPADVRMHAQYHARQDEHNDGQAAHGRRGARHLCIFGQPDVDIRRVGEGQLHVEIRGLDTYNPINGEVVPQSTADIACWFIDTAYDNRKFFVRHAYFLGDDDPYDKLRRALRADIDEAAWSSLNSTVSRPFPVPDSGCIAIKVINHYGDEILRVYGVRQG
jgi:adenine-specific DNA-methyltransferase